MSLPRAETTLDAIRLSETDAIFVSRGELSNYIEEESDLFNDLEELVPRMFQAGP